MKKTNLLFVCLLLAGIAFSQTTQKQTNAEIKLIESTDVKSVISFTFDGFQLQEIQTPKGTLQKLSLGNATPILLEGAPEILKLTASVIIPDMAEMQVNVTNSKYVDYPNVSLVPSKGDLTRDIDPATVPYTFGKVYQQDDFFPSKLALLRDPYILRDYRGQTVVVYPFQYNPVKKILRVYHEMVVEISKKSVAGRNILVRNKAIEKIASEFNNLYTQQFLNYQKQKYTPVVDEGRMLIISHGSFMADMQDFIDWKIQAGMEVEIVNVSTIGNSAAIKSYVESYYASPGLSFLLLVGDHAQVPSYSATAGMSDNTYGYIIGNDHYPEVFVGRFSAENADQVVTQVDRTVDYEKNPTISNFYAKNIGIGSDQGPGDDNELDYEHVRNMQTDLLAYNYSSCSELFDGSQGNLDAAGSPTTSMVASELNNGRGLLLYTGHGSSSSFGTSGFSSTNVNSLTNSGMLPFIWAVACVNGNFTASTCFAEAWMRAEYLDEPAGAVATLMSTINQSWNPPMCAQDEMVDILVEPYTTNIRRTFGGLSMNGCMKMNDEYGSGGNSMTDTWNCFGDPSLKVRTALPTAMMVSHATSVNLGATSFAVNCNQDGALIALTIGNEILGTGTVSSGNATINFTALATSGTMTVTATAYNKIPYWANVAIIAATGPYLDVASVGVSDPAGNNNGQADFGESIFLNVSLENIGVAAANGVNCILACTSPYVTITDNTQAFGNIAAGAQALQNQAFALSFSSNVPDQNISLLQFDMSDGASNTWTVSYPLTLNAPELSVGTHTLDDSATGDNDGLFDPGETLTMIIPSLNIGHADIGALTGTLSCTSTYISISNPTFSLAGISISGSVNASFTVTLDASVPLGESFTFDYQLTNGNYSAQESFLFQLADYCVPTYTYDCSYGDEIDDFILNTINQTGTGCSTAGYADYTNLSTSLLVGNTYTLQASTNYSNQYLSVWIDFNNNAVFESTERVVENFNLPSTASLYSTTLTIPSSANTGLHRMRARINYAANCDDPCINYTYGEAHDYMVEIVDPQLAVSLCADFSICPGETATLTPTVTGGTSPYTYLWSTGDSSSTISVLPVGATNYFLTVTDANGDSDSDDVTVSNFQIIAVDLGPDQVILPGQTITLDAGTYANYSWNTGQISPQISVTTAGIYAVTVTDNNGCEGNDEIQVTQSSPPGWNYAITSGNHTILIPDFATMTIDGQALVPGDYIGVFYDSLGSLACAGYIIWTGLTSSVTAWGSDVGNDGFAVGESFEWKIWKSTTETEYDANATYLQPPAFQNTGSFQVNGMSGIESLTGIVAQTQNLLLIQGWSMISTYIEPFEPLIDSVFAPVVSQMVIFKDGSGNIFWPQYSLNSIGNMTLGQGYQVNMTTNQNLPVTGTAPQPETVLLPIPQGWSLLGYLRNSPANIVTLFSPFTTQIIIVKDSAGNTYWPQWGVNIIGNMIPGKGYQIKLAAGVNYSYPANTTTIAASKIQIQSTQYFAKPTPTEHNMTVCIPLTAWDQVPISGSEIAAFDKHGNLIGSTLFNNENLAFAVWGDDPYSDIKDGLLTDEKFILKFWDGTEREIVVESWLEGDNHYEKNKMAVSGKISFDTDKDNLQLESYPNPASSTLSFSFILNEDKEATIELLDQLGQVVWSETEMFSKGKTEGQIDVSKLGSGCYFLSVFTEEEKDVAVVNVVR
ncbi:MAG: T9SS type A sorting domain-containing protein [Bacteroidales bacterium]|nr:T9SS type A sorting domain-containing protein [Bacteroidales bacterium]MCF8456889.1 T9SS type A sorting domain-containing protein [Bacteroidales bacterium]